MSRAEETKPLVRTKPFVIEGTRAGHGFLAKAIWLAVPGVILVAAGVLWSRAYPGDLVLGPTLFWGGLTILAIGLISPMLVQILANAIPKPTQQVEFFTNEFDVLLAEGAARSIKYSEVERVTSESMTLYIFVDGEVLEIPYLAFQTRWELERAEVLVKSRLPDDSLRSLNAA
jgi:hypothetical protein